MKEIQVVKLKKIKNSSGDILRFLKKSDPHFKKFGEVYFSWINFNKTKAWKFHSKMRMNLVVPYGKVKFVFLLKKLNKFKVINIGEKNYKMISVAPKIWYGFKGIAKNKSLIVNFTNISHNRKEIFRKKKQDIKFNW